MSKEVKVRISKGFAVGIPTLAKKRKGGPPANARQVILANDGDHLTYLALLRQYAAQHRLGLLGYCLMSNHVHLIAVPQARDSLAQALKQAHGRYATYWNARQSASGHVWQGRFYSCPLDESHLWEALRYVELNPVRAKMVAAAEDWRWSSAGVHCGSAGADTMLERERWERRWTVAEWRKFLAEDESQTSVDALRHCTHTGRPLGTQEFVAELERTMLRPLAPQKGGRPKKAASDSRQLSVTFVA